MSVKLVSYAYRMIRYTVQKCSFQVFYQNLRLVALTQIYIVVNIQAEEQLDVLVKNSIPYVDSGTRVTGLKENEKKGHIRHKNSSQQTKNNNFNKKGNSYITSFSANKTSMPIKDVRENTNRIKPSHNTQYIQWA